MNRLEVQRKGMSLPTLLGLFLAGEADIPIEPCWLNYTLYHMNISDHM
jgi:hypothetical protein